MPTKLDQSSTASRKALALFGVLLFARIPLSLKQLAERLSCSRQTVLRLMEEVEQANVLSIHKWKEGKENLYQARVPDGRPNLDFSPNELTQLVLCRDLVRHMLPQEHREWLDTATNKAALLMREAKDAVPESIGRGVVKGAIDYEAHEVMLNEIINARNTGQVLEIAYLAQSRTEPRTHAFVPMRLVSYHDGLYVRGWNVTDKGAVEIRRPMTLALHRMQEVWPTRRALKTSQPLPDESEFFGMAEQTQPFRVTVRFWPPATRYVRERIWSRDQQINEQPDGTLMLSFTAQSEMEVVKWVLGFGCEAELLEPEPLRLRTAEELRTATGRYPT